jgi:hypothetical protein
MHTVMPHVLMTTTLCAYRLKDFPAAATLWPNRTTSSSASVTLVLLAVIAILAGALVKSLRTLAALFTELLRAALKITSALVTIVVVIAVVLMVVVHH